MANRLENWETKGFLLLNKKLLQSSRGNIKKALPGNPSRAIYVSRTDLLYFIYYSFESIGVVHGQIGQHLTVQFDIGFVELSHKLAIRHPVLASTRVDTRDPQLTEVAFLSTTIAVSIQPTFFNGVFGYRPNVFAATKITFGHLHELAPTITGSYYID